MIGGAGRIDVLRERPSYDVSRRGSKAQSGTQRRIEGEVNGSWNLFRVQVHSKPYRDMHHRESDGAAEITKSSSGAQRHG